MLEATILNTNFEAIAILDTFTSFIWTDRYDKCGDFEIYTQVTDKVMATLKEDYYICVKGTDHVMIIEDTEISTDKENGNNISITGRSLESMLDRRVIWGQYILEGNLQDAIKVLLEDSIISPEIPERKIPNFIFEMTDDPNITELEIEAQYMGDNLYDVISTICESYSIGFKITLNQSNQFVFKLYSGADRSYDQTENPYVVFSPGFENIINSSYIQSKKTLKTVSLVMGEGEGASRKNVAVELESGGGSGLDRREIYTDARDISSDTGDDTTLTDEEYYSQLAQRGVEDLSFNTYTQSFEGQVETTKMFVYGTDFFMGDIVQIANEYGQESTARVIEIVTSQDTTGYSVYPTFSAVY